MSVSGTGDEKPGDAARKVVSNRIWLFCVHPPDWTSPIHLNHLHNRYLGLVRAFDNAGIKNITIKETTMEGTVAMEQNESMGAVHWKSSIG